MCGAAYPFLKAMREKKLDSYVEMFKKQMLVSAYLTGSKTLNDLKKAKLAFY